MSLKLIKDFVAEAVRGKVGASASYMKKEAVRAEIQGLIASKVKSGQITNQAELDDYINSITIAVTALKMIPHEVWKKL